MKGDTEKTGLATTGPQFNENLPHTRKLVTGSKENLFIFHGYQ